MLDWIIRSMAALMAGMRQYGQNLASGRFGQARAAASLPVGAIVRRWKPLPLGAETSLDAPVAGAETQ